MEGALIVDRLTITKAPWKSQALNSLLKITITRASIQGYRYYYGIGSLIVDLSTPK